MSIVAVELQIVVLCAVGAVLAAGAAFYFLMLPDLLAERRLNREISGREPLDDAAFYARYYAGSGVAEAIPCRLRRLYARHLGYAAEQITPGDDFRPVMNELDVSPLIADIEREFGVGLSQVDRGALDCTLGSMVQFVAGRAAMGCQQPSSR